MKRSQAAALIDQLREMAACTDRTYTATELGNMLAQFNIPPLEVCTGEAHSNTFIDNLRPLYASLGLCGAGCEGYMRHPNLYKRLLREWVRLDRFPGRYEWAKVRKVRVACLILKLRARV